jgi:hypothetical protein
LLAVLLAAPSLGAATNEKLYYSCKNKLSERVTQKELFLSITFSQHLDRAYIFGTVETARDLFDVSWKKNAPDTLRTDEMDLDIFGNETMAVYSMKFSAPVSKNLREFDVSWTLFLNGTAAPFMDNLPNPENFSCVIATKSDTVDSNLKTAAKKYLDSMSDGWNIVGPKMREYQYLKGYMGKVIRQFRRYSEISVVGREVNLDVEGTTELVKVFVIMATGDDYEVLGVYTTKGDFIAEMNAND